MRMVPGYRMISGTSMASPHVAGAAVYVANQNPRPPPAQVRSFVTAPANTDPEGSGHPDPEGSGHPDPTSLQQHPELVLRMDDY
jgi:subtilisin family serine protease